MKILLLGALLLLSTITFGQTIIYSEDFGHSITGDPQIQFSSYFFQNQNSVGECYVHYGNGHSSISGFNPYTSSHYSQSNNDNSSGDGFILLSTSPNNTVQYFQINEIDISQFENIAISFNYLSARDQETYTIQMIVEESVDGINWHYLPTYQPLINTWGFAQTYGIEPSPLLYLRFSRPICNCANIFGIDDIIITGTSVLSNNGVQIDKLTAYPNPTNGDLHFSTSTVKSIKIYDMIGKLITEDVVKNLIDTSSIQKGMYICEITQGSNREIIKFTKK
jgi:hypothetical protein